MKSIVVGVDGSEPAARALRQAVEIARATHSPLHLVYALAPPMIQEASAVGMAQLLAGHRQWADELLRAAKKEIPTDVNVDEEVRDGAPTEVINDIANERGADLIVVGNTGRGAVGRMLIGSTADRLVHTAKKPVLVVR